MKSEDLYRIGALFDTLGWPADDTPRSQFPLLFTRFCRMWERLAPEQRELIMTITPLYRWINPSEYAERFCNTWDKAVGMFPEGTQSVAIVKMPMMGARNKGPKSYDSLFYQAKGFEAMLRSSGLRVSLHPSYREYKGDEETIFAFLDDYVGTGDTIDKAITLVREGLPGARYKGIFVLALAAQEAAVTSLQAKGCTLVADTVLKRGISDSAISDIPNALRTMEEIGMRLDVKKQERLGYGKTEALVTLMRTPNNTFPVYWTIRKIGGEVWSAPFPRFTQGGKSDWGHEDIVNYPPRRIKNGSMPVEISKVLECVKGNHNIAILVEYQISYARVLHYLKLLVNEGQLEIQADRFRLTPAGQQVLLQASLVEVQNSTQSTAVHTSGAGKIPSLEELGAGQHEKKNLYVPKNPVE